jgi:HlyD family secretion protein
MALFPGMTANVGILTVDRKDVLRVPNRALRFNPDIPGAPPGDKVWVLEQGAPKAVAVTVGISGTRFSEVRGPGIREGMSVLTGMDESAPPSAAPTLGAMPGPPR